MVDKAVSEAILVVGHSRLKLTPIQCELLTLTPLRSIFINVS